MEKLKKQLYEIIFEADTRAGKLFDQALLFLILFSILVVILGSVESINSKINNLLRIIEWIITVLFTIEFAARIWLSAKPFRYIFSFYGFIDLLALLPNYLAIFIPGAHNLMVIRGLRVMRIFRILKLSRYTNAGRIILEALWNSKEKITVFIIFDIIISIIIGTFMFLIEGPENGFTDIPTSIYWAIVTLTTVGYGDLSPTTHIGQMLSSFVMLLGYSIMAVPTGIVAANIIGRQNRNTQVCSKCMYDKHDDDALYCKRCGECLDVKNHNSAKK